MCDVRGHNAAPLNRVMNTLNTPVWDNHACLPLRADDQTFLPQLDRYRLAGVHALMVNVGFGEQTLEQTLAMLATLRAWIADHPERLLLAETLGDIKRAQVERRLAIGFNIEGAAVLGDRIELIEQFHRLGVRWMLLAYNRNNSAAGGCLDDDSGLTDLGRRVLHALAAAGIVACCSHTGYRSAREAIDYSPKPVIFSHSNPRAVHDHPRNIPDDLIRACAQRGGVIGINGVDDFLGGTGSIHDVIKHIEHVADLVGVEHVGLGLDYVFDRQELKDYVRINPDLFPAQFAGREFRFIAPEQIPLIAAALRARGFAADEVVAIMGGNWLRHARQVWRR